MCLSSQLGSRLAIGGSADIYAWGSRQVIKRFHPGTPRTAAAREAACTRAARDAGAPCPETFGVIEVEGDSGVIFERIDGRSMLESLFLGAQDAAAVGRSLAQLHVQVHALRSAQLPEQRARLLGELARAPLDEPDRRRLTGQLQRLPAADRVCHGDFHPDNILIAASKPVVIDWYDATQGSHIADVAHTCLLLLHAEPPGIAATGMRAHIDSLRAVIHDAYLAHYCELSRIEERELADWRLVMAAARLERTRSAAERSALVAVIRDGLRACGS